MCSEEIQSKVDEITEDIEKQGEKVHVISDNIEKCGSVKLGITDEWKTFEKTALVKKFVDEEITLLNLRLKRMEIKAGNLSK